MVVQDDVGLGTVVGSAIYNVMFVISVCALFATSVSPRETLDKMSVKRYLPLKGCHSIGAV